MPIKPKKKLVNPNKANDPASMPVKTKVQDKVKEIKGAYDKVSKTGIPVKGGPRPKMQRMAQPTKPKRMAKRGR
jgi:hypothetical protein